MLCLHEWGAHDHPALASPQTLSLGAATLGGRCDDQFDLGPWRDIGASFPQEMFALKARAEARLVLAKLTTHYRTEKKSFGNIEPLWSDDERAHDV